MRASICCGVVNRGVALYGDQRLRRHARRPADRARPRRGTPRLGGATIDPDAALLDHRRAARGRGQGSSSATAAPTSACAATCRPTTRETGALAWRTYTVPGNPAKGFESPAMRARGRDLDRRVVEGRRRRNGLGRDGLRPGAAPALRRDRQRLAPRALAAQPRRRRQPLSRLDPRAAPRDRRARLALPDDARRRPGTTPRRSTIMLADLEIDGRLRKRAAAGAEERLLLRARPRDRRVHLGRADRRRHLGEPATTRTGRPIESDDVDYREQAALHAAEPLRRAQLAADELPSRHRARLPAGRATWAPSTRRDPDWTFHPGSLEHRPRHRARSRASAAGRAAAALEAFLLAWDPVRAARGLARRRTRRRFNGGTLSTGGNLVFEGTRRRPLRRVSRDRRQAALGVARRHRRAWPAPISYEIGGEQYVAVAAGWGGSFGSRGGEAALHGGRARRRPRARLQARRHAPSLPPRPAAARSRARRRPSRSSATRTSAARRDRALPPELLGLSRRRASSAAARAIPDLRYLERRARTRTSPTSCSAAARAEPGCRASTICSTRTTCARSRPTCSTARAPPHRRRAEPERSAARGSQAARRVASRSATSVRMPANA